MVPDDQEAVDLLQAGLSGAAASQLADMGSIAQDLSSARDMALRYAEMADAEELDDGLVAHALWNAAAVSYRRAFSSGKAMLQPGKARLRLDREAIAKLPELSEAQQLAHVLTLELADRHVAHRVGVQDDARVVAFLSPPPAPREVAGVGVFYVRMLGPEPEVARAMSEVADFLLASVTMQIGTGRDKFLEVLRADPDIDRFYAHAEQPSG